MADLNDEGATRFLETYAAAQWIFRTGDAGNAMYVVRDGEVEICREHGDTPIRVAVLGKGQFFGEMALVDQSPRSAGAMAGPNGASVLVIDNANFVYLVSQQPAFALVLLNAVVSRLRPNVAKSEDGQ